MSVSGTVAQTTFDTVSVIDRALRRCKLLEGQITSEMQQIAVQNLYLSLASLTNDGVLLWTQEQIILPIYEGQINVALPNGSIDIMNANIRQLTRLTSGTITSSAGGTADNAIDDDFDTACIQTSTNGSYTQAFDTATQVTSVGIMPYGDKFFNLVFEVSDDNVTYTTVKTIDPPTGEVATSYEDKKWTWYDIDGAQAYAYFRVRETSGGTFSVRELFLGNNPSEIPLGRMNRDDYSAFPNKTFGGKPLQFFVNRFLNAPVMSLWPAPSEAYKYFQLVIWRSRQPMDVGTMNQQLEVPQRWLDWVTYDLAYRMSLEIPEVPDSRSGLLKAQAQEAYVKAQAEERDNSPIRWQPAIGCYTR